MSDWSLYSELTELSSFAEFKAYTRTNIAQGLCVIIATHTMLNVAQWVSLALHLLCLFVFVYTRCMVYNRVRH
jgi:hypothetical protein